MEGGAGADALDGGTGTDTASYASAAVGLTANLSTPASNTGDAAGDTYTSIENLTGSAHADSLTGNAGDNVLTGGTGADALDGGAGNDVLEGGAGNDSYAFSSDHDTIRVGFGDGADLLESGGPVSSGGTDILLFNDDVSVDDVWFSQDGDDLVVQLLESQDSVRVEDWYVSSAHRRLSSIETDSFTLTAQDVESLISAMSSYTPSDGVSLGGITATTLPQDVQLAIFAAWQPVA
jgi:Ca2+-binding RTX toxin-like protein